MNIHTLFFGITADIVQDSQGCISVKTPCSLADFKQLLQDKYPALTRLDSYAFAVNETYATNDVLLQENDVVAVIPPVSGG